MKGQLTRILLFTGVVVLLAIGNAFAAPITIWDHNGNGGIGQGNEDQETEPGMINNQFWDLEAFNQVGKQLSMVGGFNFNSGYTYNSHNYKSGDIFIDVNGNAQYGENISTNPHRRALDPTRANFGYDYVIDVNWGNGTYVAYKLKTAGSSLDGVTEPLNTNESDPWRLKIVNGEQIEDSGSFNQTSYTDSQGTHYVVSGFDLAFLGGGVNFTSHFTIECGNDSLMGQGTTPVPEPATLLLLGTGLVGLAGGLRRKLFHKNQKSA